MPSRNERVGLSNMKKPLAGRAQTIVPLEEAEKSLLGAITSTAVQRDVQHSVQSDVQYTVHPSEDGPPAAALSEAEEAASSRLLNGVKKEPTEPCTYRLPVSLNKKLKATSRHYGFSMTAFVQE